MSEISSQYSVVRDQGKTFNQIGRARNFEDLTVWRLSHKLVLEIYKASKNFPKEELYGLTSQMRRASVSIPANISEGFTRRSNRDKIHFYNIAQSSLQETKYYLILIKDLDYFHATRRISLMADEIGKMLHGLIESIKDRNV